MSMISHEEFSDFFLDVRKPLVIKINTIKKKRKINQTPSLRRIRNERLELTPIFAVWQHRFLDVFVFHAVLL